MYGEEQGKRKDPRPILDKEFQNKEIRRLVEFLTRHNFGAELTLGLVKNPTSRLFLQMLEFLVRFFDPNFPSFTKEKFPEEIINVFKQLKYPFSISPKSLLSIGTLHTWPTLLVALTWLVDLIEYNEAVEASEASEVTSDTGEDLFLNDRQFFVFTGKAYQEWLRGVNSKGEEIEANMERISEARIAKMQQAIEKRKEQRDALAREIAAREQAPNKLLELENQLAQRQADLQQFQGLIAQLNEILASTAQAIDDEKAEIDSKEAEIASLIREKEQLQHIVNTQPMSVQEVEKLHAEKAAVQEQISQLRNEAQQNEKLICEKEIAASKKLEEFEKSVTQYNTLAKNFKLAPLSAKHAHGVNYELAFNAHNPNAMVDHIKGTIKPGIEQLKRSLAATITAMDIELLDQQQINEELEEQISETKEQLEALQLEVQRRQAAYKKDKEAREVHLRAAVSETEAMNAKADQIRTETENALKRSQNGLTAARRELEELEAKCTQERLEIQRIIMTSFEELAAHKNHIHNNLVALVNYMKKTKSELKGDTTANIAALQM